MSIHYVQKKFRRFQQTITQLTGIRTKVRCDVLVELLLKRNSQTATALLKGGMSTKEQFLAFLTELIVEHGVYLMSLAGAATGSRIRPVNAPFGQPLGATVGSMMGMGIFALISASSATVELKRTLKLYKDKKEVMRQGKYLIAEKKKQARAGTS